MRTGSTSALRRRGHPEEVFPLTAPTRRQLRVQFQAIVRGHRNPTPRHLAIFFRCVLLWGPIRINRGCDSTVSASENPYLGIGSHRTLQQPHVCEHEKTVRTAFLSFSDVLQNGNEQRRTSVRCSLAAPVLLRIIRQNKFWDELTRAARPALHFHCPA